jgi:hypothetical protein
MVSMSRRFARGVSPNIEENITQFPRLQNQKMRLQNASRGRARHGSCP